MMIHLNLRMIIKWEFSIHRYRACVGQLIIIVIVLVNRIYRMIVMLDYLVPDRHYSVVRMYI
jgi:hypothetical protein